MFQFHEGPVHKRTTEKIKSGNQTQDFFVSMRVLGLCGTAAAHLFIKTVHWHCFKIFKYHPVHLASGISTSYRTSSSSKPAKSNFTFHFNFTRDQRHLLSELPQTVEYSLFSKFSAMNKFLLVDLKVKWWFASRSWGHYQVQQMHLKILFSSLLISN